MTVHEFKDRMEQIFNFEIKRNKKHKLSASESYIHNLFYFIGVDRFHFTRMQMSECLGYRNVSKSIGMIENHWNRIEAIPIYNYLYLKVIDDLEPELKAKRLDVPESNPINELMELDEKTRSNFIDNRLKPFLKMLDSRKTHEDILSKRKKSIYG